MVNRLFDQIFPKELAERGQHIEIKGEVGNFSRLVEIVEADLAGICADGWPRGWRAAAVDIRLEFGWAEQLREIPAINGRILAHIPAVCQRCLEVFELPLDAPVSMLVVDPGAVPGKAAALAEHEIWELAEEALRLPDLVEESLVMAMPLAPRHGSDNFCVAVVEHTMESGPETAHPFADLRSQMEKSN